ncbi:MAG: ATP-binding protein, partial [Pseudomonadota bacterium]
DIADLVSEIRSGRTLFLNRRELPADSPHLVWLERSGTHGAALAPMRSRGRVIGAIMLAWVRYNPRSTDETATVLQATGQIIGNTLNRLRAQAAEHAYRNELRGLAVDLNRLDDRVRRETAIDLHDGAAQSLAVARMKLAQLASGSVEPEATITLVDELVGKALAEIRGVIDQLSPTALYELGVDTALSEYCDDVAAKTGLAIRYDGPDARLDVSDEEAVLLYRAARELITNAVKHADATALSLRLWQTDAETALEVEDDGIGMNADVSARKGRSGGLGLFSLTERLSHLGGWIRFDNTGRGTRVSLAIPRA